MSDSLWLRVGVPLGLFIIMFGLGSTLSRAQLMDAVRDRAALVAGLGAQLVLLPLVGILIAWMAPVSYEFKFGILILACCPGGTTSNVFTHLAKGNLALSVSLTTISSLCSLITLPLTLALGAAILVQHSVPMESMAVEGIPARGPDVDVPLGYIIKSLVVVTLLPICLGMLFRYRWPQLALRLESRISVFSSLFLAALIVIIMVREWDVLYANVASLGPILVLLSGVTMILGVALAKLFRTNVEDAVTIGLEAGIQNSGLAIFIALSLIQDELMTIPAAIYTLSMYICALSMIWVGRRRYRAVLAGDFN